MLPDGPNLDTLFVFLTVFTPPQSSYETAETLVSSVTLPCPLLDSQQEAGHRGQDRPTEDTAQQEQGGGEGEKIIFFFMQGGKKGENGRLEKEN